MARYTSDPKWMAARYASKCTCGTRINKGDTIWYIPATRTALCEGCGADEASAFNDALFDEAQYTGQW